MKYHKEIKEFKTLLIIRVSLISLYTALTLPIPFIAQNNQKILSIILFIFGLTLIFNITNDSFLVNKKGIIYQTNFISNLFGKKSWELSWKDIRKIKSYPTSQGSKVNYFVNSTKQEFMFPRRIKNTEEFISLIPDKLKVKIDKNNFSNPLWTYNLLTLLSLLMITAEIGTFTIFKDYQY